MTVEEDENMIHQSDDSQLLPPSDHVLIVPETLDEDHQKLLDEVNAEHYDNLLRSQYDITDEELENKNLSDQSSFRNLLRPAQASEDRRPLRTEHQRADHSDILFAFKGPLSFYAIGSWILSTWILIACFLLYTAHKPALRSNRLLSPVGLVAASQVLSLIRANLLIRSTLCPVNPASLPAVELNPARQMPGVRTLGYLSVVTALAFAVS
jgi:hypothetical protein